MAARLSLFGLVLGIPLLGLAVSSGVRAHFDTELRAAAVKQVPDADPIKLAGLTVARLCDTAAVESEDLCQTNTNLAFMQTASLISGGAGLGLLGLIAVAAYAARSSRNLLVALFRPGLYVAAIAISGLILAHAVIAIAAIYYGEAALVDRVHSGVIMAIGFGAIAGVTAVARSTFRIVQKAETFAVGQEVSAGEAPILWNHITRVAQKLGALAPEHVVIGLDPTFFVTEAHVLTLSGTLTGRTLFCSLPLARVLSTDEFTAIVGHELGHFRGADTKFSERFYPIYRGTATAISSLHRAGGEGLGVLALLPAIAVFGFFLECFAVAENRQSRHRELLADEAGAQATSNRTMASALVKVHAFAGIWNAVERASAEALRQGGIYTNASALFARAVLDSATSAALDGIADRHTSHPTDSHPPLAVRLASLRIDLPSVAAEALVVNPTQPAASLIPELERQEEVLSDAYQRLLAHRLGMERSAQAAVA
jgi:Zn-dependent protease with chaperone function